MNSAVVILLVGVIAACSGTGQVKNGFRGYRVYRLTPETQQQLDFLIDLNDKIESLDMSDEVDFWTHPAKVNIEFKDPILILISPEKQVDFLTVFDEQNIRHEVTINDVSSAIEEESRMSPASTRTGEKAAMTWDAYHRYDTIETFLLNLAKDYPSLVKIQTLGQTYEGRNMYLLKMGKARADGKKKPAIWMDSHIHAREWIASATLTFMINRMVTGYATNSTSKRMLDEIDWIVLPMINIDGVEFTHASTNNRMWRRTRRINPFSECIGADPNRNYDFKWMYAGAVQSPCSDTYAGAYPFSEIENLLLTEAVLENKDQLKVLLTIHSAAQMWLTPWGFDNSLPSDYNDLMNMGNQATAALKTLYGTRYRVGSSTSLLGAAAGATDDWGKAKAGIKYSYTVELRDNGQYGFLLPPHLIIPSGMETFEAINVVAKIVRSEFGPTLS